MSLLMFSHEAEGIVVMTDTYATTPEGDPRTFTSKVYAAPHLNPIIGGAGVGQLAERWFACIQSNMLVRDIETLDLHAPDALQRIWAGFHDEFDGFARAVERTAPRRRSTTSGLRGKASRSATSTGLRGTLRTRA